jgi:hypothetical protein
LLIFLPRHLVYYHQLCICKYYFLSERKTFEYKINVMKNLGGNQEWTIQRYRHFWVQDTLQRQQKYFKKNTQRRKLIRWG